jgi:hypothetical protein
MVEPKSRAGRRRVPVFPAVRDLLDDSASWGVSGTNTYRWRPVPGKSCVTLSHAVMRCQCFLGLVKRDAAMHSSCSAESPASGWRRVVAGRTR